MLTKYLESKNVVFEEVMVDTRPDGPQELLDNCGSMGVPCTHITFDGGEEVRILGFDKARFDSILNLT
jgi:hypothetical protein